MATVSGYVWKWRRDDGRFSPFTPEESARIESAYSFQTTTCDIGSYTVDFSRMVQRHKLSGFEREVQRTPVTLPASPSLTAFWTWEEARGSPVLYSIAAIVDIEQAFQQSAAMSHFSTGVDLSKCPSRLPYTLDFSTMEQTRHSYGTKRKIQRVPLTGGYSLQNLLQSSPAPMPATTKSSIFPTAYCSSSTSSSVPTNRINFGAGVGPATAALKASATGVWSLVNRATGPSGSRGRSTRVPSSVSIGNIRDPYSANIGSVPGPHSTSISGVPGPHSTYISGVTGPRSAGISGVPGPRSVGISGVPGPHSTCISGVPGPRSTSISGGPGPHAASMSSGRVPNSSASSNSVHSMQTRSSTKSSSPHVIIVPSCASSSGSLTSHLPKSTSSGVGYIGNSIVTSTSGIAHSSTSGYSGSISLKKKPSKTSKSSNSPPLGRVDWKAKAQGSEIPRYVTVEKTLKPADDGPCPICMCELSEQSGFEDDPVSLRPIPYAPPVDVCRLRKCGHMMHRACLLMMMKSESSKNGLTCPTCKRVYGVKMGNMPEGTMDVRASPYSLPGYEGYGCIEITYNFRPGVHNGQRYKASGFPRICYVPDSPKGQKVLKLLKVAWQRKLTFTIGSSVTTGVTDTVVWNEIHHKTESTSNHSGHGYPDPNYLDNVLMELCSQGVLDTESSGASSSDEDDDSL